MAASTSVTDPAGARHLGHASIGVSIAGMVIIIVIVMISVILSAAT